MLFAVVYLSMLAVLHQILDVEAARELELQAFRETACETLQVGFAQKGVSKNRRPYNMNS